MVSFWHIPRVLCGPRNFSFGGCRLCIMLSQYKRQALGAQSLPWQTVFCCAAISYWWLSWWADNNVLIYTPTTPPIPSNHLSSDLRNSEGDESIMWEKENEAFREDGSRRGTSRLTSTFYICIHICMYIYIYKYIRTVFQSETFDSFLYSGLTELLRHILPASSFADQSFVVG